MNPIDDKLQSIRPPITSQPSSKMHSKEKRIIKKEGNVSVDLVRSKLQPQLEIEESTKVDLSIKESLDLLSQERKDVQNLIKQASLLDLKKTETTLQIINQSGDKLVENIIKEGSLIKEKTSGRSSIDKDVEVEEFDVKLGDQFTPLLFNVGLLDIMPEAKIGIFKANLLSRMAASFASIMLFDKVMDVIKAKEQSLSVVDEHEKVVLQREIAILKKWASVQSSLLKKMIKKNAITTTLSTPALASTIIGLVQEPGIVGTMGSGMFGWLGLGAGLVGSALSWRMAGKNLKTHTIWTQNMKNNRNDVKKIVDNQRDIFKARLKSNLEPLEDLLNSVIEGLESVKGDKGDKKKALAEGMNKLKKAGITIPLEKPTVKRTLEYLLDPDNKAEMNIMMVKKKEALSVSLRNALKTFSERKDKIDRGFLTLALRKAKGLFTIAAVMAAAAIVLKVIAIFSVAAAAVASTATGFGALATAFGIMVIGAVYLYVKKPNIFKTYIQGVQARLCFWEIPLAVQNYRRNCAKLQLKKVTENVKEIARRVLEVERLLETGSDHKIKNFLYNHFPKLKFSDEKLAVQKILVDYRGVLKKREAECMSVRDKLTRFNESVYKFEAKVKVLQDRVDEAGWKDFQKNLNKSQVVAEGSQKDEADVLAHYLLKDATLREDSETKRLLSHMEIDLETTKKLNPSEIKTETARMIRAFFAMEEKDVMKMIKKQNLLEEHGLR